MEYLILPAAERYKEIQLLRTDADKYGSLKQYIIDSSEDAQYELEEQFIIEFIRLIVNYNI